jgi:hypothetical protein
MRFSIVLFFLAGSSTFAQSQANTGAIEGTVNDPSGAAIPNGDVSLNHLGTNFTRVLTCLTGRVAKGPFVERLDGQGRPQLTICELAEIRSI